MHIYIYIPYIRLSATCTPPERVKSPEASCEAKKSLNGSSPGSSQQFRFMSGRYRLLYGFGECVSVDIYIYMYVYVYMYIRIYVYMYICMLACAHTYVCVYIYTHISTCNYLCILYHTTAMIRNPMD